MRRDEARLGPLVFGVQPGPLRSPVATSEGVGGGRE